MSIDYFGYLGINESYTFEGGKISISCDFDKAKQLVDELTNKDGYLYPPITRTINLDPLTMKEKDVVPNTERPALLHNLPVTHSIEIADDGTIEEHRRGPSAFLINLLGFVFGYRLQFHDCWIDGRVLINGNNGLSVHHDTVEDLLSHSFGLWKSWDPESQRLITNLLFMFSRSPHYEWEWERFTIDYMVIDGIWKIDAKKKSIKKYVSHKDRINSLCETYDIPVNDSYIEEMVDLRNALLHESLCDNGQPCSAGSINAFMITIFLRNLIKRLVPAVLDYQTSFIKTSWWSLGAYRFDKRVADKKGI